MSFKEHFVSSLPGDPNEAIAVLADRAQEWMESQESPGDPIDAVYITEILHQFIERFDLPVLVQSTDGSGPHVPDYIRAIAKFSAGARVAKMLDEYEADSGDVKFGKAFLTSDEKKKVHAHLSNIREIIQDSDLEPSKKNSLFSKLNKLSMEIDRDGTPTDGFFAFAGEAAFVLGDMAQKAKPMIDEVKAVMKIVTRARARNEGVTLPPGEELLQLHSPEDEES